MKRIILKRAIIWLLVIITTQFGTIGAVLADYNGEAAYIANIGGSDYFIQKFLSSGTFIVPAGVNKVDVTVVGGGGGGGYDGGSDTDGGAGGGGGGFVSNVNNIAVAPSASITVTVGTGGSGYYGNDGRISSFGSYATANGGEGGAKSPETSNGTYGGNGGDGGSGGGGGGASYDGNGGNGGSNGGNGIAGVTTYNEDLDRYAYGGSGGIGQGTTTIGVDGVRYSGGGGGGSSWGSSSRAYGGSGGGGRGGAEGDDGTAGTANTGGGGGGAGGSSWGSSSGRGSGGDGGSGIVIVRWLANPIINITSPLPNSIYSNISGYNMLRLQGTVSGPTTGGIITTKYNIDGGATQTVAGTVTNSGSFTTTDINISSLSEGSHNLNVWCVHDQGISSSITKITFKVDKSNPTLGTVSFTSTINSITIAGSATDNIAGLDPLPYRYTLSTKPVIGWTTATSTPFSSLSANTQYTATFEARDSKGHIATKSQNIYTKAAVPTATVNNPKSYTLDVSMSDANPATTQYQIIVNTDKYVTPEGALTTSPVWITPAGKKITVKGLNASTTYTFQVKAKNGDGVETALSSSVSGTTLIAPPAAPVNLIATATDNMIRVSWDAAATATGYDIEADGSVINTGTATNYTNTPLNPGTPHTYRVRGKNAGGPGSWSTLIEKSTLPRAPGIPGNLTAIPLSTSVTVTWDNVPGAIGYDIEVDGRLVNNGPNTNYRHTSLTPGTSHTYRVRSINAGDKSDWSNLATVTTLVESTPVPEFKLPEISKNQIIISWDPVDGAAGYDIDVDGVVINNGTRTSYTHSNLLPGTEHRYRVRVKKPSSVSEWSAMIVVSTLEEGFGTPSNIKAKADAASIAISWDAVDDAVGYDVEIDGLIVDNGTETAFVHVCIANGSGSNIEHTYRVRARGVNGDISNWSELLTVKTFALPAPKNIQTTVSETSIQTVWEKVYGAASYDIEFDGTLIAGITDNGYTFEALIPGTQHTIRVRAKNITGTSNWSVPVDIATIPDGSNKAGISAIARKNSIILIWKQYDEAQSYDLEIDGTVVENITDLSYLNSSLLPGTEHTYRIRVNNSSGKGEWSSLFKASTLSETPAVPTNVAASSTMTTILVTWDTVANAESYEIEVDGVAVDVGAGTGYLHSSLVPDTAHTYRVRAKNLAGEYSGWSGPLSKSTVSSVQTYNIDCTAGDEFNLMLSAANIQDLVNYSFTVSYGIEDLEVTDLCGLTARIDESTGSITGTDIQVTQYEPGTIVFTKTGSAQTYEIWSGVVNSIRFKAKHDGQMTITYSIN